MKITVTESDFCRAFDNANRGANFSWDAREMIFAHLTEAEESTGAEIALDIIAICCGYSENSVEDIIQSYTIDVDGMDEDEQEEAVRVYLTDRTTIVGKTDVGFVYENF